MYKLSKNSLERAIDHLLKYGDTDVFPHLYELAFFKDEKAAITDELSELDLDSNHPDGAFEALAPKSRYGFRITHQLGALDTLLLLACVIEIGLKIETRRTPDSQRRDFSYRFSVDQDGQIFKKDHTYKDWLLHQEATVLKQLKIKKIIKTDISDFYARINFHRIENLLDEAAPKHGASRYIKKSIKTIRARQSFGLPVGGSAARLLAELSLTDTDKALMDQDITTTRFVDDFRIFLTKEEDPYDSLSFLAQQLSLNEGLALNAAKTNIQTRATFLASLKSQTRSC